MHRRLRASLLGLLIPCGASAQTPQSADQARQHLEQTERDRAAALAAQKAADATAALREAEAARLTAQRAAAEDRLRQAQQATSAATARMAQLTDSQHAAEAAIAQTAAQLAPLLPLIERLSRYPAETIMAVPLPPEDAARGLLVVQGIARQAGAHAAELRRQQSQLAATTAAMQSELPKLSAAQVEQSAAAADLDRQLALANEGHRVAQDESAAAARRAAELAAQATSLQALLAQLAQAQRHQKQVAFVPAKPEPRSSAGSLMAPVAGRITRGWGEPTEAGPAVGLSYQAAPGARVVAPCAGIARFAAPFRSYGTLLIIDCGGGYAAVLAGFDRLDVGLGDSVRRGQSVGTLPAQEGPALYLELRRDGEPVNPAAVLKRGSLHARPARLSKP